MLIFFFFGVGFYLYWLEDMHLLGNDCRMCLLWVMVFIIIAIIIYFLMVLHIKSDEFNVDMKY